MIVTGSIPPASAAWNLAGVEAEGVEVAGKRMLECKYCGMSFRTFAKFKSCCLKSPNHKHRFTRAK